MATKLEKNLTRESTVKAEDREIMITITADQKVSMKLKGMKSGEVSIDIEELWHQLNGTSPETPVEKSSSSSLSISTSKPKRGSNDPMMSLYDLRSHNAISGLDMTSLVKFESIIKSLIDSYPEKYGKYKKR
jgi:hypothetical protein